MNFDVKLLRRSCWLEVDLDCIKNNFGQLRNMVGPDVRIMPAVKANAYGHGIVRCCQMLQECGADYLGTGSIDEAILLRENGVTMPLLIFASNMVTEAAQLYIQYNLIPTIYSKEQAVSISAAAEGKGSHPIFVKIETGRGRLGINAEDFSALAKEIAALPNVRIEGIYSHMSCANWPDKENAYSMWQYERFKAAVESVKDCGIDIPFKQLANTPGSIAYPGIRMTGICPGRAIWGYSPLERREGHPAFKMPIQAWKSRLILVKDVTGGKFGPNFETIRLDTPKHIGVMVGGVTDGIGIGQAKGGYVLIRGKKVPVACPISIEHTTLDLTDCPEAQPGDEVIILGKQENEEITIENLMKLWGKNLIEFWMGLSPHLTRVYYKDGKPESISYGDMVHEI